jgi:photosystem II stability/assembly factor-like uncharacterized protein
VSHPPSCATARDCFVAASAQSNGNAAIEATRDGGRTWESLPLPKVGGEALAAIQLLSCPRQGGCLALAGTSSQFSGQDRVLISDLP